MSADKYNNDLQVFNTETQKEYGNVLADLQMEKYKLYVGDKEELLDSVDKIFEEEPERLFKRCKYILSRLEGVSSKMDNLFVVQGSKGKMKLRPVNFVEKCKKELYDINQIVKKKKIMDLKSMIV